MDRRHRSASRPRREDRRSGSMRSSHESMAGNLSPGRNYHGHSRRRDNSGGGFFKSFFGRRDTSPQPQPQPQPQQQHYQHPQMETPPPPPPQANSSPQSRFRALLSFAPGRSAARSPPSNVPIPQPGPAPSLPAYAAVPGRPGEDLQGPMGMQHTIEVMQDSYKNIESRLTSEQRAAQEWREKWNYQNFKLNLMVDMLVLRVLELEQPTGAPGRS